MWIERDQVKTLKEAVRTRPAVLLTGVRQAGKSTLLMRLFSKAEYITLDRILLAEEAEENPKKFLNRFKGQVIIDEIQYAPSLFRELKIEIDKQRDEKGKWILTGSQQFSLMQKVSESLAGRIRILTLGTLSVSELNRARLLKDRRDLLWKGGFPEIWAENLDAADYFADYIQTYLERDLKQILNVTNLRDFRRFLTVLALRTGQLMNLSEISREIGVAVNTVKAWVNALEISGIIILLPPFYNNLGKRIIKSPKLYFCDNGLLASLLNITSIQALENSPYQGSIWENFILTEFMKQGLVYGRDLFYFRDQHGVEIDFIIEKEGKTNLVEAKYSERPKTERLNFKKLAPLFKKQVTSIIACGIEEKGVLSLKDVLLYNPLYGSPLFES